MGERLDAGTRLGTARFGARVDLLMPRDIVEQLPALGDRLYAGVTQVGRIVPL
jgi:phosphatidylserine decarboxylase